LIAVDTNLLVYAHRPDSVSHEPARKAIESLIERGPWAIAWPSIHEFLSIVTNAKVYHRPTPIELALDQIRALLASQVLVLQEGDRHLSTLAELLSSGRMTGARVHDARIAAVCLDHGVAEFWTADRDFRRFPALRIRNPLPEFSP
jgi:toxin-antitoxin system PIN domain toxin